MSGAVRQRYRRVDERTRAAAIDAVLASMEMGVSFSAAAAAVAVELGVNESTVRTWVNDSGRRPTVNFSELAALRAQLAASAELNRQLSARIEDRGL